MADKKVISLNANVVKIPIGQIKPTNEADIDERINKLFVKYCCGGIDKPEEEMPEYIKVCREIFSNGYKAGYNDLLCKITNREWED